METEGRELPDPGLLEAGPCLGRRRPAIVGRDRHVEAETSRAPPDRKCGVRVRRLAAGEGVTMVGPPPPGDVGGAFPWPWLLLEGRRRAAPRPRQWMQASGHARVVSQATTRAPSASSPHHLPHSYSSLLARSPAECALFARGQPTDWALTAIAENRREARSPPGRGVSDSLCDRLVSAPGHHPTWRRAAGVERVARAVADEVERDDQ